MGAHIGPVSSSVAPAFREPVPPDRLPARFAFPVQELRLFSRLPVARKSTIIEGRLCETGTRGSRRGRPGPLPAHHNRSRGAPDGSSITIRNPDQCGGTCQERACLMVGRTNWLNTCSRCLLRLGEFPWVGALMSSAAAQHLRVCIGGRSATCSLE